MKGNTVLLAVAVRLSAAVGRAVVLHRHGGDDTVLAVAACAAGMDVPTLTVYEPSTTVTIATRLPETTTTVYVEDGAPAAAPADGPRSGADEQIKSQAHAVRFPDGSALQINQHPSQIIHGPHARKPQSGKAYQEPAETEAATQTTAHADLAPAIAAPGFNQASASADHLPKETAGVDQLASNSCSSSDGNMAAISAAEKPPTATGAGACLAPYGGYGPGLFLVGLLWVVNS